MIKKIIALTAAASLLLAGVTAFAMNKSERGGERGIIIIGGKVTNIKGNLVTVKDNKGEEKTFEVSSTTGLKVGAPALCEEDCGKQLRIGNTVVNVQRVMIRQLP